MAVADARGIATRDYDLPCCSRKNAHLSTLQDLLAKRHTEIDMFAGAMIRMGKEARNSRAILRVHISCH